MRIVILGAAGRLGAALARSYREKFDVVDFNHAQLDLANRNQIKTKLSPLGFDLLLNCAAFTNVDLSESKREEAFAINAEAPKQLAEICRNKKAKLIHFSTDYVFDGEKREPYIEEDPSKPISAYGESKRAGEEGQIDAVADKFSTPTYTRDIVEMLPHVWSWRALAPDGSEASRLQGILHFANTGQCSWQEYAQHAIDCCHKLKIPLKAKTVGALKLADMQNWVARRPVYSVLSTAKYTKLTGITPRSWREAVSDYIERSYSKK